MTKSQQERIDPETGQKLVRSERELTIRYRGMKKTINMPGWYSPDDTTGESGLHDSKDMRVSDRALNEMKAEVNGFFGPHEIRKIRTKKLHLTQKDAGLIIGGGPNAFQKYEAGDVLISRGINTALKLLANNPSRLNEIRDNQNPFPQE